MEKKDLKKIKKAFFRFLKDRDVYNAYVKNLKIPLDEIPPISYLFSAFIWNATEELKRINWCYLNDEWKNFLKNEMGGF